MRREGGAEEDAGAERIPASETRAGVAHPLFRQRGPRELAREASGHLGRQLRVVASRR